MAYHVEYAADSWTFLSECQMKKKESCMKLNNRKRKLMVSQNEHKDLSKFLQLKHHIGDVRPTTSRSSYFLLNSASVLDESHSTLYSWAIAFRTFSFDSPDGAFTESFSIICTQHFEKVKDAHFVSNTIPG